MTSTPNVIRRGHLAPKIVIVDGQGGCGKTMLSPIIGALERVELLSYLYEMEHICALRYLGKIDNDAAEAMVRLLTDLKLYNTMMGRDVNFRASDLSSALRAVAPYRYISRLFQKGDEEIPGRIKESQPILNLTTHNLLPFSGPVFDALGERVVFIEVVRHPLYMIKQQALNMERLLEDPRNFTVHFQDKGRQVPYWTKGWEDIFVAANPVDKSIHGIDQLTRLSRAAKERRDGQGIITVPFERFVLDPWPFLEKITMALGTSVNARTKAMMKKQKVPRVRIADGIALKIYQRCGWQPPQEGADEQRELEVRRQYVKAHASDQAMVVLDRICTDYERQYLNT